MTEYIQRIKRGKGFSYIYDGKKVDNATTARINSLAIPPAWTKVEVSTKSNSKIQATGYDAAGRKQYIYSKSYSEKQDSLKFDRILSFANKLPKLRKQVSKDLRKLRFTKTKVAAAAVYLLDQEYFRVGNQTYAMKNKTFGLTTLRSKHVTIQQDKIIFDFVGKSGQKHHKIVRDSTIFSAIKKLDDMPGYELFRYYDESGNIHDLSSNDVNEYIKTIVGEEYSAKDFRTWGGTLLAVMELVAIDRPSTQTSRKKIVTKCVKKVAKKLGNTPTIARSSYIDPRVFQIYEKSDAINEVYKTVKSMRPRKYVSQDERLVVEILSK